jgi:RNA polymerase sigma factor (sigma-70 family)
MPCFATERLLTDDHHWLFDQFDQCYARVRRPGLPSAWRLFRFCWALYETRYATRLLPGEFLSLLYQTLFGIPGKGRGLMADFDPKRYHGRLSQAGHFLNMLKRRLQARVRREFERMSDQGQVGDENRFPDRREVGLCKPRGWTREAGEASSRFDPAAVPDRPPDGPDGLDRLLETLPEALAILNPEQNRVVYLRYWLGWSYRRIGKDMGLDHKTIASLHSKALDRLRAFYREEVQEWTVGKTVRNHSPKRAPRE